MSRLMMLHTCTQRRREASHLHSESLWREQCRFPRASEDGQRAPGNAWLGVWWWLGGCQVSASAPWGLLAQTSTRCQMREYSVFPVSSPRYRTEGKKGLLCLESCQQPVIINDIECGLYPQRNIIRPLKEGKSCHMLQLRWQQC